MQKVTPLLSICIPTYMRPEILNKTLDSIYNQDVDRSLFEICISDASDDTATMDVVKDYSLRYGNIVYNKVSNMGYMNFIAALKLARGKLLKVHNDYTMFTDGGVQRMIDHAERYSPDRSLIFYLIDAKANAVGLREVESFDAFLNEISLNSTWATSHAIWREDFEKLQRQNIEFEKMFPHLSLLFAQNDKQQYVIDNAVYLQNQPVGKKGGYNLPDTFGRIYIEMLEVLYNNGSISRETIQKNKRDIAKFIATWYVHCQLGKEQFSFTFDHLFAILFRKTGLIGLVIFCTVVAEKLLRLAVRKVIRRKS